jgi:Raf kinase inhibitor-like YbhB/YbcL family protein
MMRLSSPAFKQGGQIPPRYTADGEDISPPLNWDEIPEDAIEFAVLCEDLDAAGPEPWIHWVAYCIPGMRTSLSEATAGGGFEGENSWGRPGYAGPAPPETDSAHHYQFKLYALNSTVSLGLGATAKHLREKIAGHVVAEASCTGTYERQ